MFRSLLLALLFLISPKPAQAELPSLFGIGPKSQAMGGTALDQGVYGPYQVYAAPAALGFLRHVEFAAGSQYLAPNLRPFGTVVLNSNGTLGDFRESGVLPGGGSSLGFAIPLGTHHPFTLGGAFYLPFTTLIRITGNPVDYPFYPLYTDISRNFFFVIGAGYEVIDGLAFGVNIRSTTKSTVTYVLRSDSSVNYSASATEAKSESRLSYSVLWDNSRRHPHAPYTIGGMYRAYSSMETKIGADVSAFVPIQGELTSLPSYTPAEWVLMGTYKAFDWFTFSLDLSRVIWSKYSSPYGSGNINSYVIGNRASSANFNDVTVVRYGMEQSFPISGEVIHKISFRQGYQLHPSPVPDQSGDTNFVDSTRHMFSSGFGLGFTNPMKEGDTIDVDLFFQYNLLNKRQISKNSATSVGAPGYLAGGNILLFGGGASLKF